MTDEERLANIRSRITQAQQEETRNDLLRERAEAEKKAALADLSEQFSVDTLEDAIALREKLKAKHTKDLAKLEKVLDNLGA